MSLRVETQLWEWANVDDPVADWGPATIDAAEAAGLIMPERAAEWRRLSLDPPPAQGDAAAAERHLTGLLEELRPMSYPAVPTDLPARHRFHAGLDALASAGVVDGTAAARWRERALQIEAPWLAPGDRAAVLAHRGPVAIAVPLGSPELQAVVAGEEARYERMARRGAPVAVLAADRVHRHDGVAVIAAVIRTDSTEVMFHFVGGPQGDLEEGFHRFGEVTGGLEPPALTDPAGTVYDAVDGRPVSSQGSGGPPDPERPLVIVGVWRYQPAAPVAAPAFTAEWRGERWTLLR